MNLILLSLVFLLLDRYRRKATSREIEEALGERDSLIDTLRSEIADRVIQAQGTADRAERIAQETHALMAGAEKVVFTDDHNLELAGHRKVLDAHRRDLDAQRKDLHALATGQQNLHKITKLLREQCNTNNSNAQGLRRDVNHCLERLGKVSKALEHPMPPLGDNPYPYPTPHTPPPHCYDGPNS